MSDKTLCKEIEDADAKRTENIGAESELESILTTENVRLIAERALRAAE